MLPRMINGGLAVLMVALFGSVAASRAAADEAPAAAKSSTAPAVRVHLVAPNDVVEIKVYRQPDLDTKARVAGDGTVTLPLLGSVKIGGLTAEQARDVVHELLAKDYLINPQVTLTIVEYAKSVFTVLGEVQKPGAYEVPPEQGLNLLQALALAGGYTRLGAPGKVTVQRLERGQKRLYHLDSNSMTADENTKMFEILPGDIITVGEKVF
jgi:polysaccharide export outer membrane protein